MRPSHLQKFINGCSTEAGGWRLLGPGALALPAKLCCAACSVLQLCDPTEPSRCRSPDPGRAGPLPAHTSPIKRGSETHHRHPDSELFLTEIKQRPHCSANCSRQLKKKPAIGSERSSWAAASPVLTAASEPVSSLSPNNPPLTPVCRAVSVLRRQEGSWADPILP